MKIFETKDSIAAFSDRNDGDLNFYNFNPEQIKTKWESLVEKLPIKVKMANYVNQVHKSDIVIVNNDCSLQNSSVCADGLITNISQKAIGVFTADCCPVLLSSKNSVSATHAGWKSTCQSICIKTVQKHQEIFGAKPSELTAFVGPCIGKCCFELGDEVYEKFINENKEWSKFFYRKEKWHLDLRGLNIFQLEYAGIPRNQIIDFNECTYCLQDKYYSYRRMKKHNGSMFSFIFLK